MPTVRVLSHSLLAATLACATLVAVGTAPAVAVDPVVRALTHLTDDSDGDLVVRRDADGDVDFVGVPAGVQVDHPSVTQGMAVAAAADAELDRYGPALGSTASGSTFARTSAQRAVSGDVVRYQQSVGGVRVLGGEYVVSLRANRELSSILANTTSGKTVVADAAVSEVAAVEAARSAFVKRNGAGGDIAVESDGRWLLDAGLIGGDPAAAARTVWRLHVSRGVDERRQLLVDDRTGGILMDTDEVAHADRVVCDDNNVRRATDVPCTSGFARTEGGPATGVTDVNTAYDLSGVVSDFYQQVGGVDLTALLGVSVGGVKKLASTVQWCYTNVATSCPYDNAFWNGSQMYYGQGYAGADDVVGHEMTHGFTERNSGLFYWSQSGAINESISDIIGEIIDHRHPSAGDSPTNWALGEDVPGYSPGGLRNMQDPTVLGDPDATSSTLYKLPETGSYPDQDGVHQNSGVGNKTFYLISQGGSFNGQTITGIDATDPTLTRSARLWLLVDQSLSSGSDYADLGVVLDQSCQALVPTSGSGFTAADCAAVHAATVATGLSQTPTRNPQPPDAEATCPTGTVKRVLLDSESGTPTASFTAGPTWSRDGVPGWGQVAHSNPGAWGSSNPSTIGSSPLVATTGIAVPAGQQTYLSFQQWRLLEYSGANSYDAGAVEVDRPGGRDSTATLPWINGPSQTVAPNDGNPIAGQKAFGGDSRGYLASRVDLSSYANQTIKPVFTLYSDSSGSGIGWFVDDITVFTCDLPITNAAPPTVSGTPRVGVPLAASPGAWTPATDVAFGYQWLRNAAPIAGATSAAYTPTPPDLGAALTVQVTGTRAGYLTGRAVSAPTAAVAAGALGKGKPVVKGKAKVGSTLLAKAGTWGPSAVALKYQWLRNGKPIRKATKAKYKLVAGDKGKKVSVKVTGSKAGYTTASVTSKATGKVKAKPKKRR